MAFLSVSSTVTQNSQRVQAKWLSSTLLPCRDWSTCSKLCDGGQRSRHSAGEIFGFDGWRLYHLASLPLFGVQWCAEHIGLWWGKVVLLRDSGGSSVTLDGLEMCMAHSNAPQERESHRAVVTAAQAVVWVVGIFDILLNLLGMLFLSSASICSLHRLHLFSFFQTCRVQLWMHIQNLRVPISRTPDVEPEGEGELWALGNQKGPMGTKEIAPLRLVGIRCHGIGYVSMKTWKHLRGFWATPKQYGKAQCSIREDFSLGLWSVQLCQLGEWWYEEAHSKSQFLRFSIKTDTPSGSSFAIYRGFRFAGWNLDNFETLGHRRGHSIGTFPKDQPRRRHFPPPIFHTVSIMRHEATLIVCWIQDDLIQAWDVWDHKSTTKCTKLFFLYILLLSRQWEAHFLQVSSLGWAFCHPTPTSVFEESRWSQM